LSPRERIQQAAGALDLDLPAALFNTLERGYAQGERPYHNLHHVVEVLDWLDQVAAGPGWDHPQEVLLAALFHDVIYDPLRKDNELRSADLARASIQQHLSACDLDEALVHALIEETARHGAHSHGLSRDAMHFLDADMAILGATPERFAAYDAAIRIEYAAVPDDLYAAGRRAFFEKLQASERIFLSDWFHVRLEEQARANVRTAVR